MPHFGEGIHWPKDYSYTIFWTGNAVRAKPGETSLPWITDPDGSVVLAQAWANMTDGGKICLKGDIPLLTACVLDTTPYVRNLQLVGEGQTKSVLTWEGAGYGLTVLTTTVPSGRQYVLLSDFMVDCVEKTAGRHALRVEAIGRNAYLNRLNVYLADLGLHIAGTNTVFVDGYKAVACNTGLKTEEVGAAKPNIIHITKVYMITCTDYAIFLHGGTMPVIKNALIEDCGRGIYSDSMLWNLQVEDVQIGSSTTCDIELTGTNWTYPTRVVSIKNCYFSSAIANAIVLGFVKYAHIQECHSKSHTNFVSSRADALAGDRKIRIDQPEWIEDTNLGDNLPTLILNGLGREAALTGVAPVAANWEIGDIVQNTDFPTEIWTKGVTNVMRRLA